MYFIIDEAIMFCPIFIIIMLIKVKLTNMGIFPYYELAPLGLLLFYIAPFPSIWMLVVDSVGGRFATNSQELFFAITLILLKIIISTYLESSKFQGTLGKRLNNSWIVNKSGEKVRFF